MTTLSVSTSFINKIGGRKFILVMYVMIAVTALLYLKSIDMGTFKAIVLGITLVYISGNVGQKFVTTPSSATASTSATSPTNAITNAVTDINATLSSVSGTTSAGSQ